MKWISVKDRLPEQGKGVLITNGSFVTYGWYRGDQKNKRSSCWDSHHGVSPNTTHWMLLPEPPISV